MKMTSVYIDGSENDRDSLAIAAMFCRRVGGRLDVVHAIGNEPVILPDSVAVPETDEQHISAAKLAFDGICGSLSFAHWQQMDATPAEAIRNQALLHDVIILERITGEAGPDVLALNTALFETTASVLVCPPSPPATIGTSVAIVWNASMQAARGACDHAAARTGGRGDDPDRQQQKRCTARHAD